MIKFRESDDKGAKFRDVTKKQKLNSFFHCAVPIV